MSYSIFFACGALDGACLQPDFRRVFGARAYVPVMYRYTNLKQDLRRESNAAFAKTHAQLHRRQQLARELEVIRAATEARAALSASQSRRDTGWLHPPMR